MSFLGRRRYIIRAVLVLMVLWIVNAILSIKADGRAQTTEYDDIRPKLVKAEKRSQLHGNSFSDGPLIIAAPDLGNSPGELGEPVVLPINISEDIKKAVSEGWRKNSFNQYVSDLISVRRTLVDPRDEWCKQPELYLDVLPSVSVVICFHNEAWSVLLRTVHSVIDRSPPHLLKEIILVDDFSHMPHLLQPLEDYMSSLPKVTIVRAHSRKGLIRARLLGARYTTAPVLLYLDSHCECTEGWLEPLLDRIARNKTTVVCPVIDVIDGNTLEYHYTDLSSINVGGFNWNLQFNWHLIPERERMRRKNKADPIWSPTMAGGLFAIDKEYFVNLGTYDSGFEIWGGENLELSFKTWMCGGTLEIIPCSHVGHIFRKISPYKWRTGVNVLKRNSVRLAEVWLDDYAKYYYERINNKKGYYGDISSRKALREKLGCKSFEWYVKNIYPELFIPGEAVAQGEIANRWSSMCLDSAAGDDEIKKPIGVYTCHGQNGNQYWMYSKAGEIRHDEICLDYPPGGDVALYPCHSARGSQLWMYNHNSKLLKHGNGKYCMAISKNKDKIIMESCNKAEVRQMWYMKNFNPDVLPSDLRV